MRRDRYFCELRPPGSAAILAVASVRPSNHYGLFVITSTNVISQGFYQAKIRDRAPPAAAPARE